MLASDVCDNSFLVQNNETGFLFGPRRPESIAEAIIKFHTLNMPERMAMAKKARRFAEDNLSV